ncbi:MAG: hypothetical protein WB930_06475 [Syntrophobacteraceae bacterium]
MVRDGLRGMRGGLNTGRVFSGSILYWREHRQGQHYGQEFFEQHHHGQGAGWQKGFQRGPTAASRTEGSEQGQAQGVSTESQFHAVQHEQQQQIHQQQQQQHKDEGKEKKNRKITNNSKGWNLVDVVPVRACRLQRDRKGAALIAQPLAFSGGVEGT